MNDLTDTDVGLDTDAYPRALYAPHPLLSGLVTKRQLVGAILAIQVADLVIMLVLFSQRGWPVVAFALTGLFLSYAYTAPPLRLKKIGLGEPDVFLTWGPLMVAGTYFSAVGELPWQVWVASVPYGLLCTTVLMGKHLDKIPYDAPTGTRTLPVLLGEPRARTADARAARRLLRHDAAGRRASARCRGRVLVVAGGLPLLRKVDGVAAPAATRRAAGRLPGLAAVVRRHHASCTSAAPAGCSCSACSSPPSTGVGLPLG